MPLFEAFLTAAAEHGSVVLLAAVIIVVLWRKLLKEEKTYETHQKHYEGDPDSEVSEKRNGLIRQLALDAQEREDDLRTHYEARLDLERVEQRKVMDDLLNTLRGVAE